jgi:hypothetical protein
VAYKDRGLDLKGLKQRKEINPESRTQKQTHRTKKYIQLHRNMKKKYRHTEIERRNTVT